MNFIDNKRHIILFWCLYVSGIRDYTSLQGYYIIFHIISICSCTFLFSLPLLSFFPETKAKSCLSRHRLSVYILFYRGVWQARTHSSTICISGILLYFAFGEDSHCDLSWLDLENSFRIRYICWWPIGSFFCIFWWTTSSFLVATSLRCILKIKP